MTTAGSGPAFPAGPSSWVLDPAASSAAFSHRHTWGLRTMHGTFSELAGSGEVAADGTGRGRLAIAAGSLDTGNKQRDTHLRSAAFFNVTEYPQIIMDVTSATPADAGTAIAVTGTLTVAGTSRPLNITARLSEMTGSGVTLTAETDISRADYGMTWNMLGMMSGPAHVTVTARLVPAP